MNALVRKIDEYLALRRAFGVKLKGAEAPLRKFIDFLLAAGARFVTTARALEWASQPQGVSAPHRAVRLRLVRAFAAYLNAEEPRHEVPPANLLEGRARRTRPYLYSQSEIDTVLQAARDLASPRHLKGATYATILGLLVVTGLRRSEALALDRADVDLTAGVLTVRKGKLGKSRLVPLHRTTTQALRAYARHRDQVVRVALCDGFFLNESGTRITGWALQYTWVKLTRQIGLRARDARRGPRMHDMRHRFAAESLLGWYRRGLDAARRLPVLSAYLGHVHVADTYWYLEAIPELLERAARRLDHPAEVRR